LLRRKPAPAWLQIRLRREREIGKISEIGHFNS
jgi:hypothetical protein